jgi:hypothetical protein
MIMMGLAGAQLETMLKKPELGNALVLIGVLIVLPIAFAWFCKKLAAGHDAKRNGFKMPVQNRFDLRSPKRRSRQTS